MISNPSLDYSAPLSPWLLTQEDIESQLDIEGIVTYGDRAVLSVGDTMWVQLFLFNDRPNMAADPERFQISSSAIDRIAATAIGKPWIVHPNGSKHFRGGTNRPEDIIRFQKQYARGEMVFGWRNAGSTNVNMIAAVFPQYEGEVSKMNPLTVPYVSPLIVVNSESNGQITDGEVLHVQSVDSPSYDPTIDKISGICRGMLGDCMKELRILGAAARARKPVGFELEEYIGLSPRERQRHRILGASGRQSPSRIMDPVGFELEDSMNSGRRSYTPQRRILGASSKPASGLRKPVGFELEDSMIGRA